MSKDVSAIIDGTLNTHAVIYFCFWDRVKILFGGNVLYEVKHRLEVNRLDLEVDGSLNYRQEVFRDGARVTGWWKKFIGRKYKLGEIGESPKMHLGGDNAN